MFKYYHCYAYDAALLECNNSILESLSAAMHMHYWWPVIKKKFWCEFLLPPMTVLFYMTHLK